MAKKSSVSQRLQWLRRKRGLTQAELAAQILVSRETVRDWELNRCEPSCDILVQLSSFFHVPTDFILGISNARIIRIDHLSKDQAAMVKRLISSMEKVPSDQEARQQSHPEKDEQSLI